MNITKLSEVYGEDKLLFPKYPEPWKDSQHWAQFDFYAWDYGPEVIHSEEWRYLPVVWDMRVLVWEQVVFETMLRYYETMYPETFHRDAVIPYSENEYYTHIRKSAWARKLVVPQPYEKIDHNVYYLDPQLLYDLNDKTKLYELTDCIPQRCQLLIEDIRELQDFPFVLKSNSWASGDGVRIILWQKDLEEALIWFASESQLIVEEYIDAVENIWVQIHVAQNWNVQVLDAPMQVTNSAWEYMWNIVDTWRWTDEWAVQLALEIWKNAAKKWFYGIWWMDILKSRNGKYYFIDPNFRVTWATSLILLSSKLTAETWKPVLRVGQYKSQASSIEDMLKSSYNARSQIYILSAYQDAVSRIINGFWIYAADSVEQLDESKQSIEKRWFIL